MANLMSAISAAITKSLLAKLPAAAAEKFDLDEDEFKEFLSGFLTAQLKGGAKGGRSSGPKGKNGKGRISGFIVFSGAHRKEVRDENPDIIFTEVGKVLGKMWGELTLKEKAKGNVKAAKQNEENELPTPIPGVKKAPAKKAPVKKTTKKAPVKKTAKKDVAPVLKITRNKDAKVWVIDGTSFVVQSPKNKVVVGKLRGTKVVALSAPDKKKCVQNGWEVKSADKPVATKKKPAKKVEPEEEEDHDEGDDDEGDDDEDDEGDDDDDDDDEDDE